MTSNTIRQKIFEAVISRLQRITYDNGYDRDVGVRGVYNVRKMPQSIPTPAVVVMRGIEEVELIGNGRFTCTLPIVCDFVDVYNGGDPDDEADDFLAEVEEAVMSDATTGVIEFELTVPTASGGTGTMIARVKEVSNAVNFGDPLEGKVYGRCEFEVSYERSQRDPARH
jgi:hypothetical protein